MNDRELLVAAMALRELVIAREKLRDSVETCVATCSRNGRLVVNQQAPTWHDYEAACRLVESKLLKLAGVT